MIKESIHGEIESFLSGLNQKIIPEKLSLPETSQCLGVSKSTIYGNSCARKIPYYKFGRSLFFYTKELEDCIRHGSIRHKSGAEIEREANEYLSSGARKRHKRN